ncbi:MAG: hypothetical protein GEU92_18985 [Alphaproteobacteria bacterium]|nr:hypothetical protein [Alphaproteobacteria bacterium]
MDGFKSSEFFALFCAHALVLLAPLVGYPIDSTAITVLLGLDATYIAGRSGVKAVAAAKKPAKPPSAEEVAKHVLNQLKG